jgi:polar amino acid transport system substrate-binding protein
MFGRFELGGAMRRSLFAVLATFVLAAVACSSTTPSSQPSAPASGTGQSASVNPCVANPPVKTAGVLTAGSSYPYYEPFKKGPRKDPDGFEPDIVKELAKRLNLGSVTWVNAPFESLYAPGSKEYDFAIDQISITDERKQVVDFSDPYYLIQQGLLVKEGSPVADAASIADLKQYRFGAQVGTTGLAFIKDTIQPDSKPQEYNDTNDAAQALSNGQIDAVVIDVPIAIPLADKQYPDLEVAAQFETNEGYGITFEKGSALLPCVDQALGSMKDDGTLKALQDTWLPELNVDIPVLS